MSDSEQAHCNSPKIRSRPTLSSDPGRIPVASVECVAPEAGSFIWRAHFRRLLLQMEEPLIDYKIDPEAPVRIANMVVRFTPNEKAVGAEYRHAVERAQAFRQPAAVLINEAQHLAKIGRGGGWQINWTSSSR